MRQLIFTYLLSICFASFSQNIYFPEGSRSIALGMATVCDTSAWSINNNVAGLAGLSSAAASLYYENRFLIKELNTKSISAALPLKNISLGINASQFGYHFFSRNSVGIGVAKKLNEVLSVGGKINVLNINQSDIYSDEYAYTIDLAMLYSKEKYSLGLHIYNPSLYGARYPNFSLASGIALGGALNLSEQLKTVAEININNIDNAQLGCGIEYIPHRLAKFRLGFNSLSNQLSFGFGLLLKSFSIDLSSSLHSTLGPNTNATLSYSFK